MLRINPADNVFVALRALAGGHSAYGLTLRDDIPAGHKIALHNISAGEPVVKYGYPIGVASQDIPAGSHIHSHNLRSALESRLSDLRFADVVKKFSVLSHAGSADGPQDSATFTGYRRADGRAATRNELWIVNTVGCVNHTAERLAAAAHRELATPGSGIDGVHAFTHPFGCSQLGDDLHHTQKVLAGLVNHPNAAAVLILGLGCENNQMKLFLEKLGPQERERIRYFNAQEVGDEHEAGLAALRELAAYARRFKPEPIPASELVIGMKCGGSDGYSGITANALVGRVSDTVTAMGGTAILTEVPEMFGAEQMLMDRCESRALYERTVSLIDNFKEYYKSHNQVVYENPSPGNKDGGITTLEDKSCGCVQKGGKAPVRGVLGYGEIISGKGLQLLDGPGNDIVSTTAMTASGAHIILFTTGRGTPLGAPVPTLKISSNTDLASRKGGWIDFDAGRLFTEDGDAVLADLLDLIFRTASGENRTKNETNGYREIAIFKDGVTL